MTNALKAQPSDNLLNTSYINKINFQNHKEKWEESRPFSHLVIDDFLTDDICNAVANEFPDFDDKSWRPYNNAIEIKKLLNHWDSFGPETYKLFSYLNSREFISQLEALTDCNLFPDFGLNGGGLHTHKRGGKLNVHLDYSMHPKLKLERRLNLLIYITPDWQCEWGDF